MKKFRVMIITGVMTALLLTGCGNGTKDTENTSASTTQSEITTTTANDTAESSENGANDTLDKMMSFIGKKDSEVTNAFGEGTLNQTEDNSTILSREYEITIFGEKTTASINYGDDKKVSSCSIPLSGTELDKYLVEIEKVLGKNQQIEEDKNKEEGSGRKEYIWTGDQAALSLLSAYGTLSIEINPISK